MARSNNTASYQQHLQTKRKCEIKIKICSSGVYLATLFSLIQTALLVLKIDLNYNLINMVALDALFSKGFSHMVAENYIFSLAFYGAYMLIVITFIFCTFFCLGRKHWPYIIVLLVYIVDALLCLLINSYGTFLVHLAVIVLICVALKNQSYINMITKQMWGYE